MIYYVVLIVRKSSMLSSMQYTNRTNHVFKPVVSSY